MWNLW